MPSSSVMTTAAVGLSTAGGADVLIWLTHWPLAPMPQSVAIFIAGLLAPVLHGLAQALIQRLDAGKAQIPIQVPVSAEPKP